MLFPTLAFLVFFAGVFTIAWPLGPRRTAHKLFLIAASYVFYGFWDWRFALLLLANTLANAAFAGLIDAREGVARKRMLLCAVGLNLAVLGFFKYYGFFSVEFAALFARGGWSAPLPFLEIVLPVGISFYTFQGISYVVDVHRREVKPAPLLDVVLYKAFFPQLVAGPIVRAARFLPQLGGAPRLSLRDFALGCVLIVVGLFKKLVIANTLATGLVDPVFFDPSQFGRFDLLMALYGYAMQIYCDFSGYTDMAIGLALLLGYRFDQNFNQPYRAHSLQDFWRRWHMSLSQWLRDYLYKPLGGGKRGALLTARNIAIVMLLGGLWHGAAWTFVIWGAIHGVGLIAERRLKPYLPGGRLARIAGIAVTFHLVCLAWIFFRAPTLDQALAYLHGLGVNAAGTPVATPFFVAMIAATLALQFAPGDLPARLARRLAAAGWTGVAIVTAFCLLASVLVAPPGVAPFIYFQF
jgi:alginate O-acetyltransferase complex protein AlgI